MRCSHRLDSFILLALALPAGWDRHPVQTEAPKRKCGGQFRTRCSRRAWSRSFHAARGSSPARHAAARSRQSRRNRGADSPWSRPRWSFYRDRPEFRGCPGRMPRSRAAVIKEASQNRDLSAASSGQSKSCDGECRNSGKTRARVAFRPANSAPKITTKTLEQPAIRSKISSILGCSALNGCSVWAGRMA